ncbi:MAG: hypothetical protein LBD12_00970 [Clostridiales Family XIII bacterium]|jgi:hypothetical protein|nr:hypothetical protein [Clostridiales Family XIII bacterium]
METVPMTTMRSARCRPSWRRLLPILLSLVLALTLVSAGVMTASADMGKPLFGKKKGDWMYQTVKGGVEISWDGSKTSVKVPNKLVGKKVITVTVWDDRVKKVDATAAKSMKKLTLYGTKLTSLDVSKCPELRDFASLNSPIAKIDLSGSKKLVYVQVHHAKITSLNVSNRAKLEVINLENLSLLKTLKASGNPSLDRLFVMNTKLTSLDLTGCSKARHLALSDNRLKSLKLPKNATVQNLYINGNPGLRVDARSQRRTLKEVRYSPNGGSQMVSADMRSTNYIYQNR